MPSEARLPFSAVTRGELAGLRRGVRALVERLVVERLVLVRLPVVDAFAREVVARFAVPVVRAEADRVVEPVALARVLFFVVFAAVDFALGDFALAVDFAAVRVDFAAEVRLLLVVVRFADVVALRAVVLRAAGLRPAGLEADFEAVVVRDAAGAVLRAAAADAETCARPRRRGREVVVLLSAMSTFQVRVHVGYGRIVVRTLPIC